MPWTLTVVVTPAALVVVLALLVSTGRLRDVLVGLSLLRLAIRHRPTSRICRSLTVGSGLTTRKLVGIHSISGGNRRKVLEHVLLSCRGVRSDLGAQAGIALRSVTLRSFEHW